MKVVSATLKTSDTPVKTIDTFVDDGYLQGEGGSLPDVDNDFQSDKDAVEIDKTFFTNTENNKETIVKMGQVIGKKI